MFIVCGLIRAASKGLGVRISKYSRGAATVDLKVDLWLYLPYWLCVVTHHSHMHVCSHAPVYPQSVTDKKMKRKLRGEEKTFRYMFAFTAAMTIA